MNNQKTSTEIAHLRTRHQSLVEEKRDGFTLRMHRALSWLERAEAAAEDDDVAFVCLWIAFNAAYAQELADYSEKATFRGFMERLCELDKKQALYALIWQEFSGTVRSLLNNQYVFQPFWDCLNNNDDEAQWQGAFEGAKTAAKRALAQQDTARVLYLVFQRLYTLRNQIMHGGATWNSSVNRSQVRDGRRLLARMLPSMLGIMMDWREQFQAQPFYPVMNR